MHLLLQADKEKHGNIADDPLRASFAMEKLSRIQNEYDSSSGYFFLLRQYFMSVTKLISIIAEFGTQIIPMKYRKGKGTALNVWCALNEHTSKCTDFLLNPL